ncbi:sensor histidine kinase, partial [Enterococcus faecalis]|nr:sensor histidine kinase [Enterococcus faecalis]
MKEFRFRTNSKVKSLVGRELITNNNIAIFELIKNSYDAASTEVEIRFCNFYKNNNDDWESSADSSIAVVDNGIGMTTEEIRDYWMELGKSSKEDNKIIRVNTGKMEEVINRFANGEKGIGRFGVDKIGEGLILSSVGISDDRKTTVYFDWTRYNDRSKLLEEIKNEYIVEDRKKDELHGLSLEITNLRDKWGKKEIDNLKKNIAKFLSPNRLENDDFKIFFSFIESEKEVERFEVLNDSFNYLNCKIEAALDSNGLCEMYMRNKEEISHSERNFLYPGGSPLGGIRIEIYYLDRGDKNFFTRNMGLRTSDYGNIKVFRDNFRVMPYGEPHNDWLEIDKKHAQGMFRTFGTRDLVGNIFLNGEDISKMDIFKEATDRVGLIEDAPEFQELKTFTWSVIKTFEKFIFLQFKNEAKEATEIVKVETSELRQETAASFDSLKKIIQDIDVDEPKKQELLLNFEQSSSNIIDKIKNVEKANDEIERKIKVYSQMTYKEGILYEMLHSIKNKLSIVDAQINGFERKLLTYNIEESGISILKRTYTDINKLVNGSLDKVNANKLAKVRFDIINLIKETVTSYEESLLAQDIDLYHNLNIYHEKIFVKGVPELIKTVFDNLFSNSIKALNEENKAKIEISFITKGNEIEIFFSDNGVGVPDDKKMSLFTLWSSETSGTGIGLASSRDIIEDHNGELFYVDTEGDEFNTTFMIKLPR